VPGRRCGIAAADTKLPHEVTTIWRPEVKAWIQHHAGSGFDVCYPPLHRRLEMDYLECIFGNVDDFRRAQEAANKWAEPLIKFLQSEPYKAAVKQMEATLALVDWENVRRRFSTINDCRLGAGMEGHYVRSPEPFVKPRRIGFHAD
jgi:hypothetical protein